MNEKQVHKFVNRYLEATECSILEKSPAHFTVKLSPHADRELTNRPYYWSFVDRVNAEPETMTFLFVTDKEKYDAAEEAKTNAAAVDASVSEQDAAANAALGRSLGFIHGSLAAPARVPREDLYYGARKLDQLFDAAKAKGSFVYLFQEPAKRSGNPFNSSPYTAWLGVNMRVEFACDRKREEIHCFGVSLATGQCVEQFYDRLLAHKLTPRLPANIHITKNGISFNKALGLVEQALERKLRSYDYGWAENASTRLEEELARISGYYEPLLHNALAENKPAIEEQFTQRQSEIRWQYEPRVTMSAINCGIFHLEGID
ncbi:YqhG family protein [Paenibacillus alkaliterrae]|uniref:YqhG family protein n=1 Tax=Paenibacillus alkaliterrae TaxID=320909 RepID=UPI001F492750|nr:YqhG family protein [Paenibacillus alkaliterrae]MCF2939863.1 YqhG family protein [Paenibacillus alkaliterrae]